jgi:hypothetical protein
MKGKKAVERGGKSRRRHGNALVLNDVIDGL